jgi:hypothetical protein
MGVKGILYSIGFFIGASIILSVIFAGVQLGVDYMTPPPQPLRETFVSPHDYFCEGCWKPEIEYSEDVKIITWGTGFADGLEYPEIADEGMKLALDTWSFYNPDLKFVYTNDHPDFIIYYDLEQSQTAMRTITSNDSIGVAECEEGYSGPINCIVYISVGNYDCNNEYVQADLLMVADTTMHEIGHVLGLGHVVVKSHLMYGEGFYNGDMLGYNVPEKYSEYDTYNGYRALEEQWLELEDQLEYLSDTTSVYDSNYNVKIMQYNEIVDKMNTIADEQSCYPGVE